MFEPIIKDMPHIMHGGDYNPDQWLEVPEVLKEDVRLMKLAHVNVVSIGIFAWKALEPEEGVYTFEWLDELFDRSGGKWHRCISCHAIRSKTGMDGQKSSGSIENECRPCKKSSWGTSQSLLYIALLQEKERHR